MGFRNLDAISVFAREKTITFYMRIPNYKASQLDLKAIAQAKTQPSFRLKDASVRGGVILISDSRKWSQLENEYLAAGLNFSSNSHSRVGGNDTIRVTGSSFKT